MQGGSLSDKMISTDYDKELTPHSFKEITNYNNLYKFGTGKRDPAKCKTELFNGYSNEVAHLYTELDLVKNF